MRGHSSCDSGEVAYVGGRDVENSNCRSDSSLRLHLVRNSPLASLVAPGKCGVVYGQRLSRIGRPLTATSVAGVNRRVHRRAHRRGYYGNYGYGYGTYQPSYGYGYASSRYGYGAYQYNRHTDMDTRPPAIAITSNPTTGMAPGNGGNSDRAISIVGEAGRSIWRVTTGLTKPPLQST